jgi:hypothetical protein
MMESNIKECFSNLDSTDDKVRLNALQTILKATDGKVDWVYDVWELLLKKLKDENSYQRSIAIMVLCNLARSDREGRLDGSLDLLLAHTRDEKFITTRQCIQSIWKLAMTNLHNRALVLDHLDLRFKDCVGEKHYNLIRQDIIQSIGTIAAEGKDSALFARAQGLIAQEHEEKYRRKYTAVLKGR